MAVIAGASGAATGIDPKFGTSGTLTLPRISGHVGNVAGTCRVVGNRIFISGTSGYRSSRQRQAIASVKLKSHSGAGARWTTRKIPTDQQIVAETFAPDGSYLWVTQPRKAAQAGDLTLRRAKPSGALDRSFGDRGAVKLTIPGFAPDFVGSTSILVRKDRRVVVVSTDKTNVNFRQLTARGSLDASWATNGSLSLPRPQKRGTLPVGIEKAASLLKDGGMLVAAGAAPGQPATQSARIFKLTAAGAVDTTWGDGGAWTPPTPSSSPAFSQLGISLLTGELSGGTYTVLYADSFPAEIGFTSTLRVAYVNAENGLTRIVAKKPAGSYYNGGDTGSPDTNPWRLFGVASEPVFAFDATYFDHTGGSFRGNVSVFGPSGTGGTRRLQRQIATNSISNSDFAVGPGRSLYWCGAVGSTSTKRGKLADRGLRTRVAIQRFQF